MLEHLETMRHTRSRIGHANGTTLRSLMKKVKVITHRGQIKWHIPLWIAIATSAYLILGQAVQYIDPTSGWLDTGILSLPLFAAWSCLLGYGVAGLLPAMLNQIGKKGGIEKWTSNLKVTAMLLAYIGYITVLCVLL